MSKPRPLTPRQSQIAAFIRSRRTPPTFREIMAETGIRSPNGVSCHLDALERKGVIIRQRYKHRRIIVPPDEELLGTLREAQAFIEQNAGTESGSDLRQALKREIRKLLSRN